jgi:hypothetical protein
MDRIRDEPTSDPSAHPPAIPCPWCPFTAAELAQVIAHMAARHTTRWQDLALYPPIAGKAV